MSRDSVAVTEVHHYHHRVASPGMAVLLELLPGIFLQTFGIGNIYAGRIARGVVIMLGYWALAAINVALTHVLIGVVTWPLTWLAFAVGSTLWARRAAIQAGGRA